MSHADLLTPANPYKHFARKDFGQRWPNTLINAMYLGENYSWLLIFHQKWSVTQKWLGSICSPITSWRRSSRDVTFPKHFTNIKGNVAKVSIVPEIQLLMRLVPSILSSIKAVFKNKIQRARCQEALNWVYQTFSPFICKHSCDVHNYTTLYCETTSLAQWNTTSSKSHLTWHLSSNIFVSYNRL